MAATATAIGIATLSLGAPAHAGSSDIGAGLVGFGIGAILGSMMGPPEVYFVPPPPDYYGPVVYGPPDYDGPVVYGPMPRPETGLRRARLPALKDGFAAGRYIAPAACPRPHRPRVPRRQERGGLILMPAPKFDAKFKAAQAKAKRDGVHTLTQKDIEGLSVAQLKQIRGY